MPYGLTTLKDRATQLRIKYKNGALVTQSDVWSEGAGTQMLIGEVSGGTKTRLRLCFHKASVFLEFQFVFCRNILSLNSCPAHVSKHKFVIL